MTRILSADLLIADVILPVDGHPKALALAQKYQMKPGNKMALDDATLAEFQADLYNIDARIISGGSSANMLTTLSRLLGNDIEIRFIGMAGEGAYSNILRASFEDAGIKLIPVRFPTCFASMQSAVSYVLVYPDGQCTIATHPGNARDVLKPAMIAEHLVMHSDIVLMQGSLWHKFSADFTHRLVSLSGKHQRQLWLTLPTQAHISEQERDIFFNILPQASLLFGNDAELCRLYEQPLEEALQSLQKKFREAENGKSLGFITCGKHGASIVESHAIRPVSSVPLDAKDIANTLGAGDTSYAGFAAGYIKRLPNQTSAQIAMTLAAEKLRITNSRLDDPKAALTAVAPELAELLA